MKLGELAQRVGCELHGDGEIEIVRAAPIEAAQSGEISFVANPRYTKYLKKTRASAVVLGLNVPAVEIPSLRATDPQLAFAKVVEQLYVPVASPPGVHPTAVIAASARIGARASIGAYSVIGAGVTIGDDATLAPHVVIYPEVTIGDRFTAHAQVTIRERVRIGSGVTLHAGAVIGSDGFGYVPEPDGSIRKIVQAGDVVLEDNVEIGANTTVDRAAVGSTVIRKGAKLDNLVMIAHGCEVGSGSMLAGQVGLAGSTRLGRFVRMGGQAGAAGHLTIGDGAQVAAQGGVARSVAAGAVVGGYPAMEWNKFRRVGIAFGRLPALLRRVRHLERLLGVEARDDEEA